MVEMTTKTPGKILTREFMIASAIGFLICINFFTLMATIPGYVLDVFHFDEMQAGFATGVFVLGMMFSRLFAGGLVSRIGFRPMLFMGLTGLVLSSVGYFFATDPVTFLIIRVLTGFFHGMTATTCITLVTTITPPERSGESVGYYSMCQMFAWAIGPYVGVEFLRAGNYTGIFVFCTVLLAASLLFVPFLRLKGGPFTATRARQGRDGEAGGAKGRWWEKFIEPKVLPAAAVCFFLFLFNSAVMSFMALYSETIGLAQAASVFFLVYVASLLLTRPFVSRLFDRKGYAYILYPGALLNIVSLLLLSRLHTAPMLFLSAVLFGVGFGAQQNAAAALAVKLTPRHRMGIGNATYYLVLDGVSSIGPVVAGALIPLIGYRGMYMTGSIYVAAGISLFYMLFGRKLR
ncbi:MAG: MFS transporter [Clostridiales Family XIII bacterium]|jgi:MFS family permease|nr:MFS transporter [Clostridiales Family XIII bacterium]